MKKLAVLEDLDLDEISLVDNPASPLARVVIVKNAAAPSATEPVPYITKSLARALEKATNTCVRQAQKKEKKAMKKSERKRLRKQAKAVKRQAVFAALVKEATAQASPAALGAQLVEDAVLAYPGLPRAKAVDTYLVANKDKYASYFDSTRSA